MILLEVHVNRNKCRSIFSNLAVSLSSDGSAPIPPTANKDDVWTFTVARGRYQAAVLQDLAPLTTVDIEVDGQASPQVVDMDANPTRHVVFSLKPDAAAPVDEFELRCEAKAMTPKGEVGRLTDWTTMANGGSDSCLIPPQDAEYVRLELRAEGYEHRVTDWARLNRAGPTDLGVIQLNALHAREARFMVLDAANSAPIEGARVFVLPPGKDAGAYALRDERLLEKASEAERLPETPQNTVATFVTGGDGAVTASISGDKPRTILIRKQGYVVFTLSGMDPATLSAQHEHSIALERGARIVGSIVLPPEPERPETPVMAAAQGAQFATEVEVTATSNPNEMEFVFEGLAADAYLVTLSGHSGAAPSAVLRPLGAKTVVVGENAVTRCFFDLGAGLLGGSVDGLLNNWWGADCSQGLFVAACAVSDGYRSRRIVAPTSSGAFRITGLEPGRWLVFCRDQRSRGADATLAYTWVDVERDHQVVSTALDLGASIVTIRLRGELASSARVRCKLDTPDLPVEAARTMFGAQPFIVRAGLLRVHGLPSGSYVIQREGGNAASFAVDPSTKQEIDVVVD